MKSSLHILILSGGLKMENRRGLPPHKNDVLNTVQRMVQSTPDRKTPFKRGKTWRDMVEGMSVMLPNGYSMHSYPHIAMWSKYENLYLTEK